MDIEEVKKFLLENKQGKDLLEKLVEKHESTEGLRNKRDELLNANRQMKKEKDSVEKKYKELESELEEKENSKPDTKMEIEKATLKMKKDLEEAENKIKEKESQFNNMLIENSLNESLLKSNISKNHLEAVKALIKTKNSIVIDEVDNLPKVNNKDLSTFVSEWSNSDSGKHYVSANLNSGGGARGTTTQYGMSNEDFSKLSPKERLVLARRENKNTGQ